jgi:hypothetical protein
VTTLGLMRCRIVARAIWSKPRRYSTNFGRWFVDPVQMGGCKLVANWAVTGGPPSVTMRGYGTSNGQPIRAVVTPSGLPVTCSGQTEDHGVGDSTPSLATLMAARSAARPTQDLWRSRRTDVSE